MLGLKVGMENRLQALLFVNFTLVAGSKTAELNRGSRLQNNNHYQCEVRGKVKPRRVRRRKPRYFRELFPRIKVEEGTEIRSGEE